MLLEHDELDRREAVQEEAADGRGAVDGEERAAGSTRARRPCRTQAAAACTTNAAQAFASPLSRTPCARAARWALTRSFPKKDGDPADGGFPITTSKRRAGFSSKKSATRTSAFSRCPRSRSQAASNRRAMHVQADQLGSRASRRAGGVARGGE